MVDKHTLHRCKCVNLYTKHVPKTSHVQKFVQCVPVYMHCVHVYVNLCTFEHVHLYKELTGIQVLCV